MRLLSSSLQVEVNLARWLFFSHIRYFYDIKPEGKQTPGKIHLWNVRLL